MFGCGGVGSKTKQKLEAEGEEIICFTDNSRSKWGDDFEGKRVIAPQTILQEDFDYIAIGIYKAADQIKNQLNEMGIEDSRIIIPIQPNRIFPNSEHVSEEKLRTLAKSEYSSKTTHEYKELNIQIEDEVRKPKEFDDIDIIMTSDLRDLYGKGLVIVSESAEMHPQDEYDVSDDDIILKEENHFVFRDLKFMNLTILYRKVALSDKEEARLIENFITVN